MYKKRVKYNSIVMQRKREKRAEKIGGKRIVLK